MNFFLKNQGVVTVFVILIMVPVVAITGTFVDLARFKFVSSQAIMAADSYSEGVLSIYDNVLKELYGLYSISTREEGEALIAKMGDYAKYSFNPKLDQEFQVEGSMPYASTEVEISHTNVDGASLSNSSVFLTQIADFMQYRIVGEMVKDSFILDAFDKIKKVDKEAAAVETFSEMGKNSTKVLKDIQQYYEHLEKVKQYEAYKSGLEDSFEAYSSKMGEISKSEEYEEYIYYKEHKDEIEDAISYKDAYMAALMEGAEVEADTQKLEMADKWADYDAKAYREGVDKTLTALQEAAYETEKEPVDFDSVEKEIKELKKEAEDISNRITELRNQRDKLVEQLKECSEELRTGIEKDIEGLDKILNLAEGFTKTYELIEVINKNTEKNTNNQVKYTEALPPLDEVKGKIVEGALTPGSFYWEETVELEWFDFTTNDEANDFYKQLEKACTKVNEVVGEGDEKAGDKKVDKAEGDLEKALEELKKEEEKPQRSIGAGLAGQLKLDGGTGKDEGEIGILGNFNIGQGITNVINKFLLVSYNMGMFTSRVTGIEKKAEGQEQTTGDGEYTDQSLTKVEMSPDINYLYKAEIEYLFGGKTDSKKNWNSARNTICGVRMGLNFVSTYTIKPVHRAIESVANSAATAVTASGVGAAAAPLVRIAVSGALRGAVAGMETSAEWKQLKNREKVLLFKSKVDDLEIVDKLSDIIGEPIAGGGEGKSIDIELSYEDYLYLLMLLMVDTDTLTDRTANLITLNVNQSQNKGDTLTSLDFKMSETVTAIESTCKVKMDFIVVPDNIANLFLSGTEAETRIKSLEDRFTGFTLIRGY